MDQRQRRTRAALHRAVLDLARETSPSDLTLTTVAAAAGVHRSTFYQHAADPADLLRQALLVELDDLRAGLLEDDERDTTEAVDAIVVRVLDHVSRHATIYRRGLRDGTGADSLHAMLSEHFLETGRQLLQQGRMHVSVPVSGVSADEVADTAAHFIAHGTVGVLQAWLATPGEPDAPRFLAIYRSLVPVWWAQP